MLSIILVQDLEKTHFQIITHKVNKVEEKEIKHKFNITQILAKTFKQVDQFGFALILLWLITMKKWM